MSAQGEDQTKAVAQEGEAHSRADLATPNSSRRVPALHRITTHLSTSCKFAHLFVLYLGHTGGDQKYKSPQANSLFKSLKRVGKLNDVSGSQH